MSIVYASEGGERYHRNISTECPAFETGRNIWDTDEWVPGWPSLRPIRELTVTDALARGKEPCAKCFPGQRAALHRTSSEDDFGHQPTIGISIFGLAETVCSRCTERGVWFSRGNDDFNPVHILWPCTSAVVLGLVDRKRAVAS